MKIDNRILVVLLALNLFLATVLMWTFASSSVEAKPPAGFCLDSDWPDGVARDGGYIDYYKKGKAVQVTYNPRTVYELEDSCADAVNGTRGSSGPYLYEAYCQGGIYVSITACRCSDGKCIKSPVDES